MIILEGTITNKVIKGVNGEFSVGSFNSDLGKFKIKDQLLDQFEEGEYQVRVSIRHLDIKSYHSTRNGIIITEIVADIDTISVIDAEIKSVTAESIEPDASIPDISIDKKVQATQSVKATDDKPAKSEAKGTIVLSNKKTKTTANVNEPLASSSESELFGHLWPLTDAVKLDTTLPRSMIIQQKDYLYKSGYSFDLTTQTWSK